MLRIINDLVFILNTSFSASWTSDLCCLSQGWYFHRGEGSLLLRVHLVRLITWHMLLTTKTAVCFMLIVWLVSFAKIIPCDCGECWGHTHILLLCSMRRWELDPFTTLWGIFNLTIYQNLSCCRINCMKSSSQKFELQCWWVKSQYYLVFLC